MLRKDFKFFWIFEDLFIFIIDSPVYSTPGSQDFPVYSPLWSHDSPLYSSPGSQDSPVMNTLGSGPKSLYKKATKAKTSGNWDSLWLIHWGVFTPRSFFLCEPVVMLGLNTPRIRLPMYSSQGIWDSVVCTTGESRVPGIFTTGELRFPLYSSPGSHFGHQWVILLIFRSIWQSLKIMSF